MWVQEQQKYIYVYMHDKVIYMKFGNERFITSQTSF